MDIPLLVGLVLLALVLAGGWLLVRRRNRQHLQRRFGPEYDRTVHDVGDRGKAEAELMAREKRVRKLDIVPLAPEQAARFSDEWRRLQARFIDDPKGVLLAAERLVTDLMTQRGYPMADFDTRSADLSVDHPAVVHHYRAARHIGMRARGGEVDTEALRQAVVHYRALFSELLEVQKPPHEEPQRRFGLFDNGKRATPARDPRHMQTH